jgi:catechol 2,3-dioxygenase-like lactoylglutathione lyase family enzyme
MIRGIHHVAISTGDLERSLRFYRDLLGFEEAQRFGWQAGMAIADRITGLKDSAAKSVMLRAGNAYVELFEYQSPSPKAGDPERPVCDHGITHLCLDVTDIETLYARLVAAGMRFHCPPQDAGSGIHTTYGRDPDGNVVEIQQIQDESQSIALSRAG